MCDPFTLEGIDQAFYGELMAAFVSHGGVLDGEDASIHGCSFRWNYDTESQSVHITCIKKPWVYPCGSVESGIREMVEKIKKERIS